MNKISELNELNEFNEEEKLLATPVKCKKVTTNLDELLEEFKPDYKLLKSSES